MKYVLLIFDLDPLSPASFFIPHLLTLSSLSLVRDSDVISTLARLPSAAAGGAVCGHCGVQVQGVVTELTNTNSINK